jgi:hypothetical protein
MCRTDTGEIELRGADIGGIAVHIGQRMPALAGPSFEYLNEGGRYYSQNVTVTN